MANDNDSVDSNCNSTDLKPRRSNRAKGKSMTQVEETDDNIVVNNVGYKVGDFAFFLDKKQDIYRIGMIEEFKFQKRDKLTNKKAEISIKQFYRLDEIPPSVLSNEGEFDTHVMPQNFPEWLRLREIFMSDNTLSTPSSSLRGMCTVRHFPDLNHAMALFSSSNHNNSSSPRVDHHSLINGKDGNIPVPKQRDDNTFFYVYSYNARGRKLAATYLEIRIGAAYQAELPELHAPEDKLSDVNCSLRVWEQIMWKPNQIPEDVFNMYNLATISIACFSGFGGGVDDSASVENGRKIASHMLTRQKALDCLHKAQYNMEKAVEIFAENSLPETNKIPFLWTDEDHTMFDESVKIHGKNFLRISQDKRNKKCRLVGDFVTFYYYWKKNRPKNRKYAAKKNLRSRASNAPQSEQNDNVDSNNSLKQEATTLTSESEKPSDKQGDSNNHSPNDTVQEFCVNCKSTLPKYDLNDEKNASLTERMRIICCKCQHYLRRYGHQRPLDVIKQQKDSDLEEDGGDFEEEGLNGFDEEEDEEEQEGEEDEDEEIFTSVNSPSVCKEVDDNASKVSNQSSQNAPQDNKNTLAINKYDFDEEDENVEEVTSLLKRNQAKHSIMRDADTKQSNYKAQSNGSNIFSNKTVAGYPGKTFNSKTGNFSYPNATTSNTGTGNNSVINSTNTSNQHMKSAQKPNIVSDSQMKSMKRNSILKGKMSNEKSKKRKVETPEEVITTKSSGLTNRSSLLRSNVSKQIHDSLKSTMSHSNFMDFGKKLKQKNSTIIGQNDVPSSHYDSNSSSSSSSSSSNDSSSSDEDENGVGITKKTGSSNVKFPAVPKIDVVKESKPDTTNKESVDSSYNQMITAGPNLPGVCAVTNIGEPMPQMMQNISTDLSSSLSSSVPDLNITLSEPLYKQLSLRSSVVPVTTSTTFSSTNITTESVLSVPKQTTTIPISISNNDTSKMVNFNSITNQQRIENNPEEIGLNLVKPKKRAENSYNDHNWAPPHDSPSKLVHYRGDTSTSESSLNEPPKQVINGNEIVHSSKFGYIIRTVKSTEGFSCARTDLQHTTSGLRPDDIEQRHQYITTAKQSDPLPAVNLNIQSQDSVRTGVNSMPPPMEKLHHQAVAKHMTTPPLTHSHLNISTSSVNQSSIPSPAHSRKINSNPSHTIRSPSPAGNRSQASYSTGNSNIIRTSHLHNSPLLNGSSNSFNNIRPPVLMNHMPPVGNNSLLSKISNLCKSIDSNILHSVDYVNMNKVANDILIYQAMAQSYEEMQKQEIQKYLYANMPMGNNLLNRALWEQRDRFGVTNDAWPNNLPPGSMHPPVDISTIMRALNQTQQQNSANTLNRPRSATGGLNLSNLGGLNQQNSVASSSNPTNQTNEKPGSGRASVNHISNDFQRQNDVLTENPEMMDNLIRIMTEGHLNQNVALFHMLNNQQKSSNSLHQQQQQPTPPSAHVAALNNLAGTVTGANFQNLTNPHLGVTQSILLQMQNQAACSAKPPASNNYPPNGPRLNLSDFYQLYHLGGLNRNPPR